MKSRNKKLRKKATGTAARPRLSVFRSNDRIYAQLIDDESGRTVAAADSRELKGLAAAKAPARRGKRPSDVGFTKVPEAYAVGRLLAEKAAGRKVKRVTFDRGDALYAGRVRALAEGARDGGLEF